MWKVEKKRGDTKMKSYYIIDEHDYYEGKDDTEDKEDRDDL